MMVLEHKKDAMFTRFRFGTKQRLAIRDNPFLKMGAHYTGQRLTADEYITNNEHLKEEYDAEKI